MLAPIRPQAYQIRANTAAPTKPADGDAAPSQETTQDKLAAQIVDSIVSSPEFTKQAMRRVGRGDTLKIEANGQEIVKITSDGPSVAQRMIKGAQLGITAAAAEVSQLVENDPAMSFRVAAMGVKTRVFNGVDAGLQEVAEKAFLPMMRGAALALDSKKAIDTFRNKDASVVDKIIEGVHVGTDVVGLVGALSYHVIPFDAFKNNAGLLTAIGFAGDIMSYSYRALQYLKERGQVATAAEKTTEAPPTPPPPTPGVAAPGQTDALKEAFKK